MIIKERPNFLLNKTSLVYDMDLIVIMVRFEPILHGCVINPIRNGPANSIPTLNENRHIHLIP